MFFCVFVFDYNNFIASVLVCSLRFRFVRPDDPVHFLEVERSEIIVPFRVKKRFWLLKLFSLFSRMEKCFDLALRKGKAVGETSQPRENSSSVFDCFFHNSSYIHFRNFLIFSPLNNNDILDVEIHCGLAI